jgi:hypothetical protein
VYQPVGRGVERQRRAERNRPFEPGPEQSAHVCQLPEGQHADGDLRPVAEERGAERTSARTDHLDDVAARGVDSGDVGAIDPRVAAADALLAA